MNKTVIKDFTNGLINENPTFVQLLGMCPTLAVTTSAINAIGMGLSVTVVLTASNVFISLLRKVIPSKIRIASFVVIIATFVTLVQMLLKAYIPVLDNALGLFIPLIVVNCIILGRAEAFASKNSVGRSAVDGLGMGLGFTCALTILGCVREILGSGSIFGFAIPFLSENPAVVMILPPGGFFVLGITIATVTAIRNRRKAGKDNA